MSGAEVIGLISAIVSLVEASRKVFEAAADASGLPQAFRDAAARLPAVQDTLEAASQGLEADALPSSSRDDALAKVLASCREKAASLNNILVAVVPAADAPRAERYRKALLTPPNAGKVEDLTAGMLRDLEALTANHAVRAATRAQMERLLAAVGEKGDGEGPRRPHESDGGGGLSSGAVTMHNFGSGSQYVHSGHGNQNVATGGGIQINGASTGPFYFGSAHGTSQGTRGGASTGF